MIECKVHADVHDMQGKRVLVFLRPLQPRTDYLVHAWQELEISSGATAYFNFDPTISARLDHAGKGANSGYTSRSADRVIRPGELCLATRPEGLSPTLQPAPVGMARERLTLQQAGVHNQTYPYTSVDCTWMVSGSPVVTIPGLDWGMTCTFEYAPAFYFMVSAPLMHGDNFAVQVFTDMTLCRISADASMFDVSLSREKGRWRFSFLTDLDD